MDCSRWISEDVAEVVVDGLVSVFECGWLLSGGSKV